MKFKVSSHWVGYYPEWVNQTYHHDVTAYIRGHHRPNYPVPAIPLTVEWFRYPNGTMEDVIVGILRNERITEIVYSLSYPIECY